MSPFTATRAGYNAYCDGCGKTLIRKGSSCWADDRAPGALVCVHCAGMGEPQTPGQHGAPEPVLPGQTIIEMD